MSIDDDYVSRELFRSVALGIACGLVLGLLAHAYMLGVTHIASIAQPLRESEMEQISNLKTSYAIIAIAFAPFAEEFLFRGMLFRALDREWGGWRAILGSAVFFASYHPVAAWLPVGVLGAVNAVLFKKTGWLPAAVAAHTFYNAVVVLM